MAQLEFHVPLDVLSTPKTGECLVDHWWLVHEEKGALLWGDSTAGILSRQPSPAANRDQRITERFKRKGYEVVQVRVAYMSHCYGPMNAAVDEYKAKRSA